MSLLDTEIAFDPQERLYSFELSLCSPARPRRAQMLYGWS